ncbi:hypothetical protein C8J57DRAFT_1307617 [Mycena rebaudengoi]|nr:hypothetical protein C8J57DRAFT_1307617 [Mycena rebaudengoi]
MYRETVQMPVGVGYPCYAAVGGGASEAASYVGRRAAWRGGGAARCLARYIFAELCVFGVLWVRLWAVLVPTTLSSTMPMSVSASSYPGWRVVFVEWGEVRAYMRSILLDGDPFIVRGGKLSVSGRVSTSSWPVKDTRWGCL